MITPKTAKKLKSSHTVMSNKKSRNGNYRFGLFGDGVFLNGCFDYIMLKSTQKGAFCGGVGGNRSVSFCAHRHAAPKNSPPDCFLNGCFDYIILKSTLKGAFFWWSWW